MRAQHAAHDVDGLLASARELAMKRLNAVIEDNQTLRWQDADDIAQESIIKIWQTLDRDKPAHIVAWVKEVVDNTMLNYLKAAKRYDAIFVPMPEFDESDDERDIRIAFPCEEAAEVFLCIDNGETQREIAASMGITRKALECRIARWKEKIIIRQVRD
jgi:DNA-directed RNA polymerase specialized sigma24 family protein